MTDYTAPERIWLGLDLGNESAGFHDLNTVDWGSVKSHSSDVEYIRADLHRAEVDALVAGAQCLRDAQRAYMADRGNNDLGRLVGIRAEKLDAVLAALTPADARAALRDREEAAVRRALEEAQKDG